jgi:hypothetical protein
MYVMGGKGHSFFFSSTLNDNAYLCYCNSTVMYKFLKPYTLAGFEPGIFGSVGGRDDHYATQPWALRATVFARLQVPWRHQVEKPELRVQFFFSFSDKFFSGHKNFYSVDDGSLVKLETIRHLVRHFLRFPGLGCSCQWKKNKNVVSAFRVVCLCVAEKCWKCFRPIFLSPLNFELKQLCGARQPDVTRFLLFFVVQNNSWVFIQIITTTLFRNWRKPYFQHTVM